MVHVLGLKDCKTMLVAMATKIQEVLGVFQGVRTNLDFGDKLNVIWDTLGKEMKVRNPCLERGEWKLFKLGFGSWTIH